jgi:hypothetical protein
MKDDLEKIVDESTERALTKAEDPNVAKKLVYAVGRGIKAATISGYDSLVRQYEGNPEAAKKHAVHSVVGIGVGVGLTALTGFGVIPLVALGYGALRLYHTGKDVNEYYQEWKEGKRRPRL